MLVRKIIDAVPSPFLAHGTANVSATLPSETPSCFSNPISPSKIGPGPVLHARANSPEHTPYRAAFPNTTPFEFDRPSTRPRRIASFGTLPMRSELPVKH